MITKNQETKILSEISTSRTNSQEREELMPIIQHKKNKKEDLNYSCDFPSCNKVYSQKYRLEIHKRTHVIILFNYFRQDLNPLNVKHVLNVLQKKEI